MGVLRCRINPLRLWSNAGRLAPHNRWYREEGTSRAMERYHTMRAYSAGGVVFRLASMNTPETNFVIDTSGSGRETCSPEEIITMEVVLVGRSHVGIWALPKGTPNPGETIEQVA